jgi:uncharacterized protein YndB with AHSA1/START domain
MSIHQEAIIDAAPEQVYAVLTDGEKFAAATGQPARLSDQEGDEFTLFGGRVEGRQIELVPGERVVQAWRFGGAHPDTWDAGIYSVVASRSSRRGRPRSSSSITKVSRRSGRSTSRRATRPSIRAHWRATSPRR